MEIIKLNKHSLLFASIMVKSMTNMFGLLEVKITAKVRKRVFTPWKAWKKQWCNLTKSTTGLELIIYSEIPVPGTTSIPIQSVIIPDTCLCYRTESRTKPFAFGLFFDSKSHKALMYLAGNSESNSQEWIYAIRLILDQNKDLIITVPEDYLAYTISIIDNAHSRAAGYLGVYGSIIVTERGLEIYQPHKSNNINSTSSKCISWSHIKQFHLSGKRNEIDERKICIIHTSELFESGVGELFIFCSEAPKLLHAIMTQCNVILTTKLSTSKQNFVIEHAESINSLINDPCLRQKNDTYNNISSAYLPYHRISRSEGDLCGYCDDRDSGWSSCSPPECSSLLTFDDKLENEAQLSSSDESMIILNDKPAKTFKIEDSKSMIDTKDDEIFEANMDISEYNPRRVSSVSIASGVYEEIIETIIQNSKPLSSLYEEPVYMPPPLPPRRRFISQTSMSDDGIEEFEECNCSTPVTAKSVHNFNHHCSIKFSTNINKHRKLSVGSLKEEHMCFDNSNHKKIDLTYIPRCNTEPQKNLRQSQIYLENKAYQVTKKQKNRFDLTPIKNKFNYLMKKASLENEGSPKSRSYFYNSLPRSLNVHKCTQKFDNDDIIKKETSRSCEMLECDLMEIRPKSITRSCELLDCIAKVTPKTDFSVDDLNQKHDLLSVKSKLEIVKNVYQNLNTEADNLVENEDPDFIHMRNKFIGCKISENECEYVSMSPRTQPNLLQECDYVDMTGPNKFIEVAENQV